MTSLTALKHRRHFAVEMIEGLLRQHWLGRDLRYLLIRGQPAMRGNMKAIDLLLRTEADAVLERSLLRHLSFSFYAIRIRDFAYLNCRSWGRTENPAKETEDSSQVIVPA